MLAGSTKKFSSVLTPWVQGRLSPPLGREVQQSHCHPPDTPILHYILYTFIQDEIRVLPERTQQEKMLSCTSYDLSQYLRCSSIAFLLYWKFHSLVREEKLQKQLYFCTNSISLSDVSCTRSLILRCAFRIGAETIFDSSMELILLYDSVFYCLLYVIVSFIATYVLCSEWNSPLYDSTLWVSVAFILSIKEDNCKEQIRPEGRLLNWTHFKEGKQSCQNFDFLIPKEPLIQSAAWSTGSRNETPLAWPLVSITVGGICIYIVNAQTFFTSWSMKSPFRWSKKYNRPFLRGVTVWPKASVTQREFEHSILTSASTSLLEAACFASQSFTTYLSLGTCLRYVDIIRGWSLEENLFTIFQTRNYSPKLGLQGGSSFGGHDVPVVWQSMDFVEHNPLYAEVAWKKKWAQKNLSCRICFYCFSMNVVPFSASCLNGFSPCCTTIMLFKLYARCKMSCISHDMFVRSCCISELLAQFLLSSWRTGDAGMLLSHPQIPLYFS